jgi:hypothetical protein
MTDPGAKTSTPKAHPLARGVMRVLTDRDDADLRFVFAALARRIGPGGGDGRRESALLALERCASELGITQPTARKYATWRTTSDAGRGALSVQQIRTLFDGSWGHAVQAMPQVPGSDPLTRRMVARGPSFTDAECLDALKRWHAETGETTGRSYGAWADRTRRAEQTVRIPASIDPIRNRFGSWAQALKAAGVTWPTQGPRHSRRQRVRNPTREEVTDALRLAYGELGEPFTSVRYDEWVQRKASAHANSNTPFRISSSATICNIFGNWSTVVAEVLGSDGAALEALRQRQIRFSEADLVRAWWECRTALGMVPSIGDYSRWRSATAERCGFKQWAPSYSSIVQRLGDGSWHRACMKLQDEGPPDA